MQESALLIGSPNGHSPLIESCLAELQLDVVSADTGETALRLLAPEHHALAVCDLPLADMGPTALVSQIRRAASPSPARPRARDWRRLFTPAPMSAWRGLSTRRDSLRSLPVA